MALNAKFPGLLGINELNDRIMAMHDEFKKIKYRGTPESIKQTEHWFQRWYDFYNEWIGRAGKLTREIMQALNDKYNEQRKVINQIKAQSDKIAKKLKEQAKEKAEREKQLARQAEIDAAEEEKARKQAAEDILKEQKAREEQLKSQESIEEKERKEYERKKRAAKIEIPSYGVHDYPSLSKSWDAIIDVWTRIEVLPEQSIVNSVEGAIERWLNHYEGQVRYYLDMGQSVPDNIIADLPKWQKLYRNTKAVIGKAAGESVVMAEYETAPPLPPEKIKLAPGETFDPETGMVMGVEQLITGRVPGVAPPAPLIGPGGILDPGRPGLPPPVILPPVEPRYEPPPTVIIKQVIPAYEPTEPEIPPDEPIIFEPATPRLSDIGGGLVEPSIIDDPFAGIPEEFKSTWPWFAALGAIIFFAKSR